MASQAILQPQPLVATVRDSEPTIRSVLGTPLCLTTYRGFDSFCQSVARHGKTTVVDFSNTQIITMRRSEPAFRELTSRVDYFVPDGMPLIWCLNWQGAGLRDRVYGPAFMRHCLANSPAEVTHYFLGGSAHCLERLQQNALAQNPRLNVVGARQGYFRPDEEAAIVEEINRLDPDFVWVGLGTPKQQAWIHRHKGHIRRGVVFAVGFAFDVIAQTKRDAPLWMQRRGLTWVYRLCSEPRRLAGRYLRYNSLFLFYLLWDGCRGRAWTQPKALNEPQ